MAMKFAPRTFQCACLPLTANACRPSTTGVRNWAVSGSSRRVCGRCGGGLHLAHLFSLHLARIAARRHSSA